jgi:hypothetical protein
VEYVVPSVFNFEMVIAPNVESFTVIEELTIVELLNHARTPM